MGADVVTEACLRMPTLGLPVDAEGVLTDPVARSQLAGVWSTLIRHLGAAAGERTPSGEK